MATLNYKHLRYFWMVARTGSIARAAEQLHLTPQSISGQLSEFADALGVVLFRRTGRTLELSEAGRRMLSYADEIFALGDEMLDVVRDTQTVLSLPTPLDQTFRAHRPRPAQSDRAGSWRQR